MIITIDLDNILDRIYAESAWHAAYQPEVKLLTPDNARMLEMRIEDGLADLHSRISGYVSSWNYNPYIDNGNITIGLALPATMEAQADAVRGIVVDLLANYALMRFYGDDGTYYGTAWRLNRVRLMLLMARATMN